ncbi:transposase [Roseateles sp. SL47]|uniref:transposase n=1 Tax=Roseateles sp. SL47 TaxID=2995138 RepID=UPI00226E3EDC|nr:transposase [Roseateles sp. SL47]WAC75703.1 transposase [Roseateles sp. SL47]
MTTIPNNQAVPRRRRRVHSDEFKARAVASCMQPGMSVAAVAMAHGVNANLLRRWVREAEMKPPARDLAQVAEQPVQATRRQQAAGFVAGRITPGFTVRYACTPG